MILFRLTRKTALYSAGLCLGVSLVVALAASGAFWLFTRQTTSEKAPQSVSSADGKQSVESAENAASPDQEIPSFSEDAGVPSAGAPRRLTMNGVEYVFRWIPEGTFTMGSPREETGRSAEEAQHEVRISQGFWALETEVTQEMWTPVMEDNPSRFQYSERLPVENVSWNDCLRYVEKLNALNLCPQGLKFALPTEAQWEYACRAGTTTPFSFGDFLNNNSANYGINYVYTIDEKNVFWGATSIVKNYRPNQWGLYDMHGNVAEWTADWRGDYPKYRTTDPKGPERGRHRVYRGGSWKDEASSCRSACRASAETGARADGIGLRLVLVKVDNTPDAP